MTDYLEVRISKFGRFHLLPKINNGAITANGRPSISYCGKITDRILDYLDYHLNLLVSLISSYIKDTY